MGVVLSLVRSAWVLSYAALTVPVLLLTGIAIAGGLPTKNRVANIVLSILGNQMAEMPWIALVLDITCYLWLSITGTARKCPVPA